MKIVDLSRELYHRTPSYPGQPPIIHGVWKNHEESFRDSGNVHGNAVMYFSMPDHGGTHIDAPRHFGATATPINEYPLENCIVPGICIDLRHIPPRAEIVPADLEAAVRGLDAHQRGRAERLARRRVDDRVEQGIDRPRLGSEVRAEGGQVCEWCIEQVLPAGRRIRIVRLRP